MRDITTREDISIIMTEFYDRILLDPALRPIFVDVAHIDLPRHLPMIIDFWESILLGTGSYQGNVMALHVDLNRKFPLTNVHFELWLHHLTATVKEHFAGETAELMLVRAQSIATVMRIKLIQAV